MKAVPSRTTTRLLGIPLRHQGAHDALCAYYSAAMMMWALRPELDDAFDAPSVALDPILGNLPRRGKTSVSQAAAAALSAGLHLRDVTRALNRACRRSSTRFGYRVARQGDDAFVRAQLESGLPVVVGWDSRELGNHTVLAVGFDVYRRSRSAWFRVQDPTRSQDVLEWKQLWALAKGGVELIWCKSHRGIRPDRLTTQRNARGALIPSATRLHRWDPALQAYQPLRQA